MCNSYYKKGLNSSYFVDDDYRKETDPDWKNIDVPYKYYLSFLNHQWDHLKNLSNYINCFQNKKVLDVGCGTAGFLDLIFLKAKFVMGIEKSKKLRKLNNIINNKKILVIEDLDLINSNIKFDTITLFSTLEHIPNPEKFISKLKKKLVREGLLILGCINASDYRLLEEPIKNFGKINGKEVFFNEKYANVFFRKSYCNYFSLKGLKYLMNNEGLVLNSFFYKERYDYNNFLKYKPHNLNIIKSNVSSLNYKEYVEKNLISDYMYLIFKNN